MSERGGAERNISIRGCVGMGVRLGSHVCLFVCLFVCSWVGRPTLLLSVCSRVGRGPLPRLTRSLFVPGRAREGGLAATHPCPTRPTHPLALIAIGG